MLFSAEGEKNKTFLKTHYKLPTCCTDSHISATERVSFIISRPPPTEVISAHYLFWIQILLRRAAVYETDGCVRKIISFKICQIIRLLYQKS